MPRLKVFRLSLIVAVCAALALAGCGKKGPLYLPDQPRPATPNNTD